MKVHKKFGEVFQKLFKMNVGNLTNFRFKVGFVIHSGPSRGSQNVPRFGITLGQRLAPRVTSYSYLGPGGPVQLKAWAWSSGAHL